jgi:hypothetical protein
MKSLHTVRRKVTWEERPTILPRSVWEKYADKEFWRVPAEPDFAVKTGYVYDGV